MSIDDEIEELESRCAPSASGPIGRGLLIDVPHHIDIVDPGADSSDAGFLE